MQHVGLFLYFYLIWCLLNWVPGFQALALGVPVAGFVVYLTYDLPISIPSKFLWQPMRHLTFWCYHIPVFWWEHFKANLDVAYRVIHPKLPIRPAVVRVKTELKTDMGLSFLANSICLVPGTTVVDLDREKGILYVHCMWVDSPDMERDAQRLTTKFERILKRAFE